MFEMWAQCSCLFLSSVWLRYDGSESLECAPLGLFWSLGCCRNNGVSKQCLLRKTSLRKRSSLKNASSPEPGLCDQDLAMPCGVPAVPELKPGSAGLACPEMEWSMLALCQGIRAAAESQKSLPRFY